MQWIECIKCGIKKQHTLKYFYPSKNISGLMNICKDCSNKKNKEWRDKNKDKIKNRRLIYRYNITLENFNKMVKNQNGKCEICGIIPKEGLKVDHDHKTDQVRSLLCYNCNVALGNIRDNPLISIKIARYLKKHRDVESDLV